MHTHVSNRNLERVKLILWAAMGVWAVVTIARFGHGIGATSGLNDVAPWGFWIAFDVMAGVALAAGGFVVAAIVYIFGIERYHHFARPAILTALLGYIAVAVGLLYDLGIPWHIWHPMIMPQHHSVLFEVAMCVMCYLTVLALEFSPAILEHPWFHKPFFQRILWLVRKLTIPLVIAGIVLSTLHQSSLGSLFLIQPFRVHPLWYSPILYVLFFISAVGLGLMMVTLEALVSGWLFGHKIDVAGLAGFGRLASLVLCVYVIVRVGDLWYRGVIPEHLIGDWASGLFLAELLISAVIPATALMFKRVRHSIAGLATCSSMTVIGVIMHRFDTCIVAFDRPYDFGYWPTWTEVAISAGIISGAALVFIFFNENLRIVEHHGDKVVQQKPADDHSYEKPTGVGGFTPALRRHSLAFVIAAGCAIGLLPESALFGPQPEPTPVSLARNVNALAVDAPLPIRRKFYLSSLSGTVPAADNPHAVRLTLIDGNRDWRFVAFTHDKHVEQLGGDESCHLCHHQNMTFDQNSACYQCHQDMYEVTDIFNHNLHIERLGYNDACVVCHPDTTAGKSRENSLACWQCHGDMVVEGSIVPPPQNGLVGYAPGYMEAMHGLCVRCHKKIAEEQPDTHADFDRCDVCHHDFENRDQRRMAPYVPMPPDHMREQLFPTPFEKSKTKDKASDQPATLTARD